MQLVSVIIIPHTENYLFVAEIHVNNKKTARLSIIFIKENAVSWMVLAFWHVCMCISDHRESMEYGSGSGPIFLEGLNCDGSEDSLMDCERKPNPVLTCTHQNDAGVFCQSI